MYPRSRLQYHLGTGHQSVAAFRCQVGDELGHVVFERVLERLELGVVFGVERDLVMVGHISAAHADRGVCFHLALKTLGNLRRLDRTPEQACKRAFHYPLDKFLKPL